MDSQLHAISKNLFVYHDICNVYIVKRGKRAICIDAGSGAVAGALKSIGIDKVDWVYFTHHHRDQCQGWRALKKMGAHFAVPEYEQTLFGDCENYWRNRMIHDSYNDRSTYNTLVQSVPVDAILEDYEIRRRGHVPLTVLATPGHTMGSLSLVGDIDGRRVAFTGDVVREHGKLHSLHDLEYGYGARQGVSMLALSATNLKREKLDLICPSHGQIVTEPDSALDALRENLRAFREWDVPIMASRSEPDAPFPSDFQCRAVLPHLLSFPSCVCCFYVLLGPKGHALFIDYGIADLNHFSAAGSHREWWERQRFVAHALPELRERYGVEQIDVAMITHYHDDHVAGIPYLQRHHGTEVWTHECLVDILERPRNYAEMCLYHKPVKVGRVLKEGARVRWRGIPITAWHFPGQTEHHQITLMEIDGKRVCFIGDSWDPPLIFRNFHRYGSHVECMEKLKRIRPDIILPGHGFPIEPTPTYYEKYERRALRLNQLFDTLLPESERWQGIECFWARIKPYQMSARRGKIFRLSVSVKNFNGRAEEVDVSLHLPKGWQPAPLRKSARIQPRETRGLTFRVRVPERWRGEPRVAITADVRVGERNFGEVCEGVVEVED